MHTNPVQRTLAPQNEAAAKAAPRHNAASQMASVPQDKVTLSPQAQAKLEAHPTQKAPTAGKAPGGDKK